MGFLSSAYNLKLQNVNLQVAKPKRGEKGLHIWLIMHHLQSRHVPTCHSENWKNNVINHLN